jgi:hypothetical protein
MKSKLTVAAAGVLVMLGSGLATVAPASAATDSVTACAKEPPIYTFSNKVVSLRPTNLYSPYQTGGTISYNKTVTATASYSATATVSAEAGVVFAKASTSLGVTVGASYASSGAFTSTLFVPAGQRRRMRLFQAGRAFKVTKQMFNQQTCKYYVKYSGAAASAPKVVREDEWRLEA